MKYILNVVINDLEDSEASVILSSEAECLKIEKFLTDLLGDTDVLITWNEEQEETF